MSKKELLFSVTASDCDFDYYVGPGDGGQKKQKTKSGVRCTHRDSGAVGKCHKDRMQLQNRKSAFEKMANTEEFKKWHKLETARRMGELDKIEQEIEASLKRIKIETKNTEGRWVETKEQDLKDE